MHEPSKLQQAMLIQLDQHWQSLDLQFNARATAGTTAGAVSVVLGMRFLAVPCMYGFTHVCMYGFMYACMHSI